VVLPPGLPFGGTDELKVAAELLVDRLTVEIQKVDTLQVVDRSQVARLLRERELAGALGPAAPASRPLVSYDAMVKLEIDAARATPEARLSVLDLSTGNVLEQASHPWPITDESLRAMGELCRKAAAKVGKAAPKRLKVRLPGLEPVGPDVRMRALGSRLARTFQESLARSEGIVLVEHLEATSSLDEALLLALGMSKPPGGRRFVPHSDATVELRLREVDSVNRTFEETTVEIGVRLRQGPKSQADWIPTKGTVRDFDGLIETAWTSLAKPLAGAKPGAASAWLDDRADRRRQADSELRAAKDAPLPERIAHLEAALKIDPMHEEVTWQLIDSLGNLTRNRPEYHNHPDSLRILPLAIRYLELFPPNRDRLGSIQFQLVSVTRNREFDPPPADLEAVPLTEVQRTKLDHLKRFMELSVSGDIHAAGTQSSRVMMDVCHGMRRTGVPLAQREAWMDWVVAQCEKQAVGIPSLVGVPSSYAVEISWIDHSSIRLRVVEEAVKDRRHDRAKKLLESYHSYFETNRDVRLHSAERIRGIYRAIKDVDGLASFEKRNAQLDGTVVHPMSIRWSGIPLFDPELPAKLPSTPIRYCRQSDGYTWQITPLAEGKGRLYVLVREKNFPKLGYLPLDASGRPKGELVKKQGKWNPLALETVVLLPPYPLPDRLHLKGSRFFRGKLYVYGNDSGLLEFDPETDRWKTYGPEQGLPLVNLDTLLPLDEHTLQCRGNVSGETEYKRIACNLDLRTGKVVVVSRDELYGETPYPKELYHIWSDGGTVWRQVEEGFTWRERSGAETKRERSRAMPYGWQLSTWRWKETYAAVELAGRRFLWCSDGLHQVDATGKTLQSWLSACRVHPDPLVQSWAVDLPPDSPVAGGLLGATDRMLVFHGGRELARKSFNTLQLFDLESDTWYQAETAENLGWVGVLGSGGVWLGGDERMSFVALVDILAEAQAAGRVIKTADYGARKAQAIEAAPPLERAKYLFAMRRFPEAIALFEPLAAGAEVSPEVLILLGQAYEPSQPDKALDAYRRLAASKDRSAALTGLVFEHRLLRDRKQTDAAREIAQKILREFPQLDSFLGDTLKASAK